MIVDGLGNEVKAGDTLLEFGRGWGCLGGSEYVHHLKIWEMPEGEFKGWAYYYSLDGSKHKFWWADPKKAVKLPIDDLPNGFFYSFRHGMTSIASKINSGELLDVINQSNWTHQEVNPEAVDKYSFLSELSIESIDDIKKNLHHIKSANSIPYSLVDKVFKVFEIERTPVNNGELGIAALYDRTKFETLIEMVDGK